MDADTMKAITELTERLSLVQRDVALLLDRLAVTHLDGPPFMSLNLSEMTDKMIRAALTVAGGNRTKAARLLGISRRTIYRSFGCKF